MRKQWGILIAGLLLAVGVTGCMDTVNTVENQPKVMVPESVQSKYISTDSFCRDRLKIVSIDRKTAPGGLLMIQVTVRSERYGFWSEIWAWIMDANPYTVDYKFDWLDQAGFQVNTAASVWLPIDFMPGEIKRLQAVAPNANCKDFMLSLKEH